MRLLFVSNLYPPHHIGGYELVCQRTADGLQERGHQLQVLTSSFGSGVQEDDLVRRVLKCVYQPPSYFPDAGMADAEENSRILRDTIQEFKPDVVLLWNLHGLGMHHLYSTALAEARQVATRLGDYQFWPNWDPDQPIPAEGLSILKDPRLRCATNCKALGDDLIRAGVDRDGIAVLHSYVELFWEALPNPPSPPPPLRLLWAGRISHHKGLPVATEAAIILSTEYGIPTMLDVVGQGDEETLTSCLSSAKARSADLQMRYLGTVDRRQLAELFPQYHAYVAPSLGHEAFPMTCVEAMAAGVPVVASRLGGLVEITDDGKLGQLFEPGDPRDLARQLRRLAADRDLWMRLRAGARGHVEGNFTRDISLDRYEAFLEGCSLGLDVADMGPDVPKMAIRQPRRWWTRPWGNQGSGHRLWRHSDIIAQH